ncbi:transcriptional regulator, MerR family [Alteromonadaceae bacterium Bs31]|nr:transcriptional regulator, MerR family [Alteromonadaceae bacterium Bs31]
MLTVSQLAKRCNISRTSVLYYEREGLLQPTLRSANGYRWYGDSEIERLESIVAYRAYGLAVNSIATLLDQTDAPSQAQLLKDHFNQLEGAIQQLRQQQKAIVAMLKDPQLLEENMVTKDRWVDIMKAAGFSEAQMLSWHQKFEQMEPEEHQKFLESLGIEAQEIAQIRKL